MYNLPPFCCICFNNKEELKNINSKECIESQILNKLSFCSFETEWLVPDFPVFICRKCAHILDIACDFKNMCLKSNRVLKGYVSQLKSASNNTNSADIIRNELYMMFNNHPDKNSHLQMGIDYNIPKNNDPGPSKIYSRNDVKIKTESEEFKCLSNKMVKSNDKSDKIVLQSEVISFCDIKNEFSELANCSNPIDNVINTENFNFEIKQTQHQCSLCHKCFSRESVLTRHMLIHSGERPHHCNICNKNFTHKFNLKQHLLIHSGHKNHHCSVCDKGFIKKSDLDRHMLTHFGERIHHCSLCSKSFVRKENLNQHILTHTGQKPHHCTQCSKSFLRKSDLNRHTLLCISKRT